MSQMNSKEFVQNTLHSRFVTLNILNILDLHIFKDCVPYYETYKRYRARKQQNFSSSLFSYMTIFIGFCNLQQNCVYAWSWSFVNLQINLILIWWYSTWQLCHSQDPRLNGDLISGGITKIKLWKGMVFYTSSI